MAALNVRISRPAHQMLRWLADGEGSSMQAVLDKAIEEYRRKRFLEAANQAFQALRDDPKAGAEEVAERQVWDSTLADDLEGT